MGEDDVNGRTDGETEELATEPDTVSTPRAAIEPPVPAAADSRRDGSATTPPSGRWSRRRVLGLVGGGVATAGVVGVGGVTLRHAMAQGAGDQDHFAAYAFHGRHQAGITTPAQARLHFASFDVTTTSREELIALLTAWTHAAARLTQGAPAGEFGPVDGPYLAPPDDTGEAMDLPASRLTLTFGFGSSLFTTADGVDRFGLASARPAGLVDLPHFAGDALDPARCNGDLCVQACAEDPQVAVHAIRNLARIGFGKVSLRWSQLGYGRTSSTSTAQVTPRNLFGFKDGTANIKLEDPVALAEHVWVAEGDDPEHAWMVDGTYLVARRINMHIETWDRGSLHEQESIVGRDKGEGAPLSGGTEFTEPDFEATGRDGTPLVGEDSHVRLAHPLVNDGARLLRRGYNFADGSNGLGRMDAGLFFLAFVRDPAKQYIPMQTRLALEDSMSEYLEHTGSAIYAVPPGVSVRGDYIGQALFA